MIWIAIQGIVVLSSRLVVDKSLEVHSPTQLDRALFDPTKRNDSVLGNGVHFSCTFLVVSFFYHCIPGCGAIHVSMLGVRIQLSPCWLVITYIHLDFDGVDKIIPDQVTGIK